ncbi:hypothetical protein GCM10009630_07700 [Kribbella jejuensis]
MHDQPGVAVLDLDEVDVPPALHRALEDSGLCQLDPFAEQQVTPVDRGPTGNLVLRQNPHVIGDDITEPPSPAPLAGSM